MENNENKDMILQEDTAEAEKAVISENDKSSANKLSESKALKEAVESDKNVDKKLQKVKESMKRTFTFNPRTLRHGSIAAVLTCLFIVAMIVLNMIAGKLETKIPALRVDTTTEKFFEISDETLKFAKSVNKDVEIFVMCTEDNFISYDGDGYFKQANSILNQFANSNDKITLRYIDMLANPTFVSNYPDDSASITASDIIVQSGEDYKIIKASDMFNISYDSSTYLSYITSSRAEQAVASAVLNVTSDEKLNVAFLIGYNEQEYEDFQSFLSANGCNTTKVSLLSEEIGEDIDVAIIFSPTTDYDVEAVEKVENWLNLGGKGLIYTPYYLSEETPQLDAMLEQYGLKVGDGIVFENDTSRLVSTDSYFITLTDYVNTDFTDSLKSTDKPVISALAKPVEITDKDKARLMLQGSETAGIYPIDADGLEDTDDLIVPNVGVCAIGTNQVTDDSKSSIVVVGSSMALSSDAFTRAAYNNGDYFLNVVNVMSGKEASIISISPKSVDAERLGLTAEQMHRFGFIFMALIPIITLVIGFVIWFRRRNK